MRATVVVPTYDERDAIEPVVEAILSQPGGYRVVVVDDDSPDGTGRLADELALRHAGRVTVLHRLQKDGLGRAYADGFTRALADGAELVFQMDGDSSHDSAALASLRGPLERGDADLILGSRYCAGGGVRAWGLGRRLLSRWGSLYSRTLLRLPFRDMTGGFKGWRADLLATIDACSASSRGYAFQVEMTLRAARAGARITEVPIIFTERSAGRSKMTLAVAIEAAWRIPLLAAGRHASTAHSVAGWTAREARAHGHRR